MSQRCSVIYGQLCKILLVRSKGLDRIQFCMRHFHDADSPWSWSCVCICWCHFCEVLKICTGLIFQETTNLVRIFLLYTYRRNFKNIYTALWRPINIRQDAFFGGENNDYKHKIVHVITKSWFQITKICLFNHKYPLSLQTQKFPG